MEQLNPMKKETVNCRIGSLEKYRKDIRALGKVNCRIGSLEKYRKDIRALGKVNCRIGSLEISSKYPESFTFR